VALTREAARAGAEAVLVVPPHYYRSSMTESVLLRHYQTVADASDVPVILYHVPKFAPVTFSLGLILDLARHPNIAGIKETSGDLNLFAAILRERPPSFRVYVGAGGHLLAGAALGADGGVLAVANVAPLLCVEILELTAAGRLEEARALQMRLLSVNHAVTAGHGIAGLKYALRRLGYRSGDSLRPLEPLDPEAERHIDRVLEEAGLA
jgi:4-hydroxy-2-oxoglutarate aldolase